MYLEQWIHDKIRREVEDNPEYQRYTGRRSLEKVTSRDIEGIQLSRLRKTLDYACSKSPFYRELFQKKGIRADDIESLNDLANVPFTWPADLADSPYRLLCVPPREVERVFTHTTAGTTGQPKKVFFLAEELQGITDYMGAAMKTVALFGGAVSSGYKVTMFLPDGRAMSQADLLATGVERHGGLPLRRDIALSAEEQIRVIESDNPDIIFGSTSRLYRITQSVVQTHDLRKTRAKVLFLTSEYLSEAMREQLRGAWGADVYVHYGMTEMGLAGGIECRAHNGYHFDEADFLFEVVNPATGAILDLGNEGELVFTTLSRVGMPLIRYRTGDLSSLTAEPCACGASTLKRIGKVRKRVGSIIRLGGGGEIYPTMFDDVLYTIGSIIDYQVALTKEGDKESLTFKVEVTKKEKATEEDITKAILSIAPIEKNIKADIMTETKVELLDPGTLRREGRTKRLIADRR